MSIIEHAYDVVYEIIYLYLEDSDLDLDKDELELMSSEMSEDIIDVLDGEIGLEHFGMD